MLFTEKHMFNKKNVRDKCFIQKFKIFKYFLLIFHRIKTMYFDVKQILIKLQRKEKEV